MRGDEGTIYGKVWGTTQCVFRAGTHEVHVIRAAAGGFCSRHRHVGKHNLFHVLSGRLKVCTVKDGLEDEIVLGPGQSSVVAPGNLHWFEALEDVVALEVYWVALDPDDIVRESHGGRRGGG